MISHDKGFFSQNPIFHDLKFFSGESMFFSPCFVFFQKIKNMLFICKISNEMYPGNEH